MALRFEARGANGGSKSFLGDPLNDETGTPDGVGRDNHFAGGSIYWTQKTGARSNFEHGYIRWSAQTGAVAAHSVLID